jgi:DNA-binding transcriptional LysR family regulator
MNNFRSVTAQPLNSRQLLAFVTVARTRSFTLAGRVLFLSQSAVSHALTALEDELNCKLFDRDGKQLQLTPAGEHLLHYAEKILADMELARGSLQQRTRWGASSLRVAADGVFGPSLLPGVLKLFRREFPDWLINVKSGDSRECVEWLKQDVLDVAIAIAPSRAEAVEIVPLFTDELMWIVSSSHPWALSGNVPMEEISSQPLVCNSAGSYTYRLLEKYFERDGLRLNWQLELGSLEAVKEMVKGGGGVTVLAPWAVREELADKSLTALPLGKRKLKRNWCLLRSLNRESRLADETFVKFCVQAAKLLTAAPTLTVVLTNLLWISGMDFGGVDLGWLDLGGMDLGCLDFNICSVAV